MSKNTQIQRNTTFKELFSSKLSYGQLSGCFFIEKLEKSRLILLFSGCPLKKRGAELGFSWNLLKRVVEHRIFKLKKGRSHEELLNFLKVVAQLPYLKFQKPLTFLGFLGFKLRNTKRNKVLFDGEKYQKS